MSNQHERRDRILDLVRAQGFASIDSLAQRFAVTPQTIRRDINALSDAALLRRYHGGAGLPSNVENTAYANRQVMNRAAKKAIADMVVRHIPDQASLFINIGTTTEAVAAALTDRRDLRIITNNLNVAVMLAAREDFQILVTGGQVPGTAQLAATASTSATPDDASNTTSSPVSMSMAVIRRSRSGQS